MHEEIVPHEDADMVGGAAGLEENQVPQAGRPGRHPATDLHLLPGGAGNGEAVGVAHDDLDEGGAVDAPARSAAQTVGRALPLAEFLDEARFGRWGGLPGGAARGGQQRGQQKAEQWPVAGGQGG